MSIETLKKIALLVKEGHTGKALSAIEAAIEQAEKRWSEFNETTKRNIEHADWYLSTHPAPVDHLLSEITKLWGVIHDQQQKLTEASEQQPVGIVQVLPLGDGHKPMHWADWTDSDNPPPEGTPLYTTPPAAQQQWVSLTDEVKQDMATDYFDADWAVQKALQLIDEHEAKLREKNT